MSALIDARERLGPGRLVLVVGPSGAGKDTLINLARVQRQASDIRFVRRIVTRAASDFENNAELSIADFHEAMARGEFALWWQAHHHWYGLPRDIDDEIRAGRTVVANGSRTVIAQARKAYANVIVVLITAPSHVLAARLAARGRDSDGDVEQRVMRTIDDAAVGADFTIVNTNTPQIHARELMRAITAADVAPTQDDFLSSDDFASP